MHNFIADAATGNLKIEDLPAGVLCRVRAIFSYVKEDVDELSFEVGDIIQMIDYDDPKDKVNPRFIPPPLPPLLN